MESTGICKKAKLEEMKHDAYEHLIAIAELDPVEMHGSECEIADHALAIVMHYGTYDEAAKALDAYFDFKYAKDELVFA